MSLLIETTIKVSVIVVFALVATALLRKRSAALRHWVLAAAILCAALSPMLRPIAPAWYLQLNTPSTNQPVTAQPPKATAVGGSGETTAVVSVVGPSEKTPFNIDRILALTWAGGVAISFFMLIAGLVRLSWLASRAERLVDGYWVRLTKQLSQSIGLTRPVTLLQSDHPSLPVTWGFQRPKVVLPEAARDWSDERLRVVLLHELAHIKRGDWLTQLAAECMRAIYWFNPLVWMVSRRLRQESEQACDDAVLNGGVEGANYASHLLALARSAAAERRTFFQGFPAPAMARPSSLERRFSAMLNGRLNRRPITRPARLVTTTAVLIVTVLIAGFGAQTFSSFSGSVVDSTDRVVPGVTLLLTNLQTQAKYEIKSDGAGRFEFVGLPAGEYAWQAGLPGFSTIKGNVTVGGQDIQRDLTLRVGSLAETVTIKGSDSSSPARTRPATDASAVRRPQSSQPCMAGPIGGTVKAPTKVRDVAPQYPPDLNAAKIGGVVILDVVVNPAGDVGDVSVLRSPHPGLELAAVEAVRQWQYTPTLLNCVPVEMRLNVTAAFVSQP